MTNVSKTNAGMVETLTLPHRPIRRILQGGGATWISPGALEEMERAIVQRGEMIAAEAVFLVEHSKRKTIKKRDLELANRRLNGV